MVVSPLATLAVIGLGRVLNHRSGKARADEIKVDLTAQTNAIKTDLTSAIRETRTDMIANMSQLRNDLTGAILRAESAADKTEAGLKEFFRLELRAAMADIRTTIAEKQGCVVYEERAIKAGSIQGTEAE